MISTGRDREREKERERERERERYVENLHNFQNQIPTGNHQGRKLIFGVRLHFSLL